MYHLTQRMSMLRTASRPRSRREAGLRTRGFTLIELMVTVAIVAILAAVALPSYLNHVRQANRAAAQGYMLELSNLEQRYLLDAKQYAPAAANTDLATLGWSVPTNVQSNYSMQITTTTTPPGFVITATPINSQVKDTTCGALSINEAGTKTANSVTACW